MQRKKINPLIRWWMTPYLPYEDIYGLPSLKNNNIFSVLSFKYKKWFVYPLRRRLAKRHLENIRENSDIKVIGVTGSAGKTSTVQMIESILKIQDKTISGEVSIDPVYSIPNTILRIGNNTKYLLLEMGVEYVGEMNYYLWLAKPDIGVITNIYPTHTEFFGDRMGVFREKSKLVKNLGVNNIAILNAKDNLLKKLKRKLQCKTVWFGEGGEIKSSEIQFTDDFKTKFLLILGQNSKRIWISLPVLGEQYVENALAAAAVAISLNIPLDVIKKGLESYQIPPHRMKVLKHKSGALIIDDSYNNNPEAAKAALVTFAEAAKTRKKVVIFGDMKELGNKENEYHKELGQYMITSKIGIDALVCVGKLSKVTAKFAAKILGKKNVHSVITTREALPLVKQYLTKDFAILVKGSRSLGLDKLVSELLSA